MPTGRGLQVNLPEHSLRQALPSSSCALQILIPPKKGSFHPVLTERALCLARPAASVFPHTSATDLNMEFLTDCSHLTAWLHG